jgi:hypothetical protein
MKTRKRFILVALVLVLVAALVAQAIMSGGLPGFTNDPNVAALVAQTTTSRGDDQSRACIEKALPTGDTTDRRYFLKGALFALGTITKMRNEAPRACCDGKHILPGLEGVEVVVEDVNPKAEKYGLTRQLLQTDTELRLRQNGIRVLTDEQAPNQEAEQDNKWTETKLAKWRSVTESLAQQEDVYFLRALRDFVQHEGGPSSALPPYLYINVAAVASEEEVGVAAFSIVVQLKDWASVRRNGAFCDAAIWGTGSVHSCSSSLLKEKVRESLRDTLDEFINAYLAANPKDRSPEEKQ